MPWKPSFKGEVPTLGFEIIDWCHEMLARPDNGGTYEPLRFYLEQEDIILRWYELDPRTGRRKFTRGVVERSRGWGKSPFLAALAIVEGLGPVVPDGWDADGQPVGRPWSESRTPKINIAAVSEEQVDNTWEPLLEMLHEEASVHDHYRGIEPLETFVALGSRRGRIDRLTSSARTVKGKGAAFTVMDQTEEWTKSNGGQKLATVLRSNAAKVKGTLLESPNAFIPGEGSVAEGSYNFWEDIKAKRARDTSLMYDTREAPPETDLTDRDSLILGLRHAYGDSSGHEDGCLLHTPPCKPGHVDLDRLISTIWDPETDEQTARSDFLNQVEAASDSWVSRVEWKLCYDPEVTLEPGDTIVIGFDGSQGRVKGKADATALIGMRISDGFTFELGVWEAEKGKEEEFVAPVMEVEGVLDYAHRTYRVIGFFGDPSGWVEPMARWARKYGHRYRVKPSQKDPIAAWPTGRTSQVEHHVEVMRKSIVNQEICHRADPNLTRHVLNARRRNTRSGYLLFKKYPMSPEKIDSAYAMMLANRARLEAIKLGVNTDNRAAQSNRRKGRVMIS